MTSPSPPIALRHPWALVLEAQMRAAGRLAGHNEDLALASDPRATGEALDRLARDHFGKIVYRHYDDTKEAREFVEVLEALTINPNISSATTEFVIEAVEDSEKLNRVLARSLGKNPARLIGRLENPQLSERVDSLVALFTQDPDDLRELAFHSSEGVRYNVACNGETPHDLLLALARDPEESVQERLVFADDSEIHKALATSTFPSVRMDVAERTTFPEVLNILADDSDPEVVLLVTQNKHTWKKTKNRIDQRYEQGTLEAEESDRASCSDKLGSEPKDWLEEARDPVTSSDRLRQLSHFTSDRFASKEERRELHLAIAANPNTSTRTLREMIPLMETDVVLVDTIAKNEGRLLARLTGDPESIELDVVLAANTDNPDALRELAMSTDERVCIAVGMNEYTPADIREALARHPNETVVAASTLWSHDLSEATQLRLASYPHFEVQYELVKNTRLPSVLKKMVRESEHYRDDAFWWELKENPKSTRAILEMWVDRYNLEMGEGITLEEFEAWDR